MKFDLEAWLILLEGFQVEILKPKIKEWCIKRTLQRLDIDLVWQLASFLAEQQNLKEDEFVEYGEIYFIRNLTLLEDSFIALGG